MEGLSERRRVRRGDIALALAAIGLAVAAGVLATRFPPGARMWPMMALGVMLVGALGALAQSLYQGSRSGEDEAEPLLHPRRIALFIGLIAIFDALLSTLGFVTAAAFALLAIPWLLEERRWAKVAATGAVFLVAAYLLFNKLVQKSLPPDWFWN